MGRGAGATRGLSADPEARTRTLDIIVEVMTLTRIFDRKSPTRGPDAFASSKPLPLLRLHHALPTRRRLRADPVPSAVPPAADPLRRGHGRLPGGREAAVGTDDGGL